MFSTIVLSYVIFVKYPPWFLHTVETLSETGPRSCWNSVFSSCCLVCNHPLMESGKVLTKSGNVLTKSRKVLTKWETAHEKQETPSSFHQLLAVLIVF